MSRASVKKLTPLLPPRFLRFCAVGLSGVVVNLGVFRLVKALLGAAALSDDLRFELGHVAGVAVSILTNFILNDRWTWSDRVRVKSFSLGQRLLAFYGVSLVGALVQLGTAWFTRRSLPVGDDVAVLIGIGVATLFNFVSNDRLTFRRRAPET